VRAIDPAYEDCPGDGWLKRFLGAGVLVSGLIYLGWRTTAFNPDAPVVSAGFFFIELLGFVASLVVLFVALDRRKRAVRPAPSGLTVDVFVATLNEDMRTVRRTLVAATRIRYPHETWLLDDGDRPQFRELARELGCRYLARRSTKGAKAGNINHGLSHSTGAFVALLDADHCPQPDFLDRLLGHFDDPAVAFVQTPQDYYNTGSFQHAFDRSAASVWHEQSNFNHVLQPGRDHHGATMLCGCSCILRRTHLERVGGFPEEAVTEDMHAAVRLQKLGLKAVFHDEPLAFGVAPPDFRGFLRQRLRWGEGNMQVCRLEGVPFTRKLNLRQNICYALLALAYADSWRKLALYLAPPLSLLFEVPPVYGEPSSFLFFFLPYCTLALIAYSEFSGGFNRLLLIETFDMARLGVGILATWGLFRRRIRFRISSKRLTGRPALNLILPQLAIGAVCAGAVLVVLFRWLSVAQGFREAASPMWLEAILLVLCLYHFALSALVLRLAIRSGSFDEVNFAHAVELPLRVVGGIYPGPWQWTRALSLDTAFVAAPPLPCRRVAVQILLPDGPLRVDAMRDVDGTGGQRFDFMWDDVTDRDRLDQALHAGRWHRVLAGRSEVGWTFLELLGVRKVPTARMPATRAPWHPVVLAGAHDDVELAYMRAADTAVPTAELIHFGRPRARGLMLAAGWPSWDGSALVVEGPAYTPMLDEGALDPLGATRVAVRFEAVQVPVESGEEWRSEHTALAAD
jgi:cellulose synthase/poly-beta-1,6-N-acetylglucosamine synthase-like glycosyltransferase